MLKKVRGILNKLTPDNFEKLLEKIKQLDIAKSNARLSGIIDLIFGKVSFNRNTVLNFLLLY